MNEAPEGYFLLGYIGRAHGIRGQVRVVLAVQYPEDYAGLPSLWVQGPRGLHQHTIEELTLQAHQEGILKLQGIDTREAAEALAGSSLHLPLSQLPALGANEFFYHEIIGYTLVDASMGVVGVISSVRSMPGQDLLVVAHASGAEVLVPLADQWQPVIDRAARQLRMQLPLGLVDVYLQAPSPADRDDEVTTD